MQFTKFNAVRRLASGFLLLLAASTGTPPLSAQENQPASPEAASRDAAARRPTLPAPSDALLAELERIYKDIHANPELAMQEHRTAGIAAKWLNEHGYEVTEKVGGTGVGGVLRNGEGATVLLRADMDAIPSNHSPQFAPVLHPTLRTGVETMLAAAGAWLAPADVEP
ncbi:hypothetical protein [Candidatus Laterigemmans baculatus]|uniref:hypothetical protein n=1 Tax=Candidatus Laterigemmans baculatus TaxID=2770505 RepID=UPI00193B579C|nr:hypothetical protein [Candidatus Laterigemmans baculatus]